MALYFWLIVAGGLGTLSRFLIYRVAASTGALSLPSGTLIANLGGSFLIGYLSWTMMQKWALSKELQTVIMSGFLGGFTTFSAFSLDTVQLIEREHFIGAAAYLSISVIGSVLLCFAGLMLARQLG